MAWSEAPFIALALICLLSLACFLSSNADRMILSKRAWFCMAVAAAAIACLTRYAGIPLVLAGSAAVAWRYSNRRLGLALALLFLLVSLSPMLLWMGRNKAVTGYAAGPRYPSRVTVLTNLRRTAYTIGTWYIPSPLDPGAKRSAAGILLFVGVFAWTRWLRQRKSTVAANHLGIDHHLLCLVWWYAILYPAYLVATASLIAFDDLGDRLLAPLYPAALLLAASASRSLIDVSSPTRAAFVLGAMFALLARDGLKGMWTTLKDHRNAGSGFASRYAPVPGLRAAIEPELRSGDTALFSNNPGRLWWTHRIVAVDAPRVRPSFNAAGDVPISARYARYSAEHRRGRRALLVWYDPPGPKYVPLEEVRAHYGDTRPLWVSSGCAVYEVRPLVRRR
jgi:hypothetical protein